jgi:hypothetical protein
MRKSHIIEAHVRAQIIKRKVSEEDEKSSEEKRWLHSFKGREVRAVIEMLKCIFSLQCFLLFLR